MKFYKAWVKCINVDGHDGPGNDRLTIGKSYYGVNYDKDEESPSIHILDDTGELSALFDGEFEVLQITGEQLGNIVLERKVKVAILEMNDDW